MLRLILFGAGASYGCENAIPYCPPLGQDLFDDLCKLYPKAWGEVPKEKRGKFVPNFEPGMKELWDSGWHGTAVLMRCMADYFARFRPLDGNAYARLLEHLSAYGSIAGTCFSTINYDCILEYAIRNLGLKVRYDSRDPSTDAALTVWKIHGSCNFLPASVSGGAGAISYSANAISWDGEVQVVDASQVGAFVARNAFYPAMAVFMEGKPVRSHPGLLNQLQVWWKDAAQKATKVGLVGVRPNVQDQHIWGPLASTDAELIIIGDKVAYEAWQKEHRPTKRTVIIGSRFAHSLADFARAFSS